jgi:hypothetical protein
MASFRGWPASIPTPAYRAAVVGVIAELVGWIDQSSVQEQWRWYR